MIDCDLLCSQNRLLLEFGGMGKRKEYMSTGFLVLELLKKRYQQNLTYISTWGSNCLPQIHIGILVGLPAPDVKGRASKSYSA